MVANFLPEESLVIQKVLFCFITQYFSLTINLPYNFLHIIFLSQLIHWLIQFIQDLSSTLNICSNSDMNESVNKTPARGRGGSWQLRISLRLCLPSSLPRHGTSRYATPSTRPRRAHHPRPSVVTLTCRRRAGT
jgi:hypothetical protein